MRELIGVIFLNNCVGLDSVEEYGIKVPDNKSALPHWSLEGFW